MNLRNIAIAGIATILLTMGATCSGVIEPTPTGGDSRNIPSGAQASAIVFPQHDAPLGTDRGGEYFAGRLILSKGCLRADPLASATNNHPSWLIIWPSSFTLEAESGTVQIVDGHGRIATRVGDYIRLSRAAVTY